MITKELLDYIRIQKKRGLSREEIITSLVGVGWKKQDLAEAFKKEAQNQNKDIETPEYEDYLPAIAQATSHPEPLRIIEHDFSDMPLHSNIPSASRSLFFYLFIAIIIFAGISGTLILIDTDKALLTLKPLILYGN